MTQITLNSVLDANDAELYDDLFRWFEMYEFTGLPDGTEIQASIEAADSGMPFYVRRGLDYIYGDTSVSWTYQAGDTLWIMASSYWSDTPFSLTVSTTTDLPDLQVLLWSGHGSAASETQNGSAADDYFLGLAGDDLLIGNGGFDTFNGGSGDDTLQGGAESDVYFVDSPGDVIVDGGNEGFQFDQVVSTVSWTLGDTLENLYLSGFADIDGIGNGQSNIILGNFGSNLLLGGTGDDVLSDSIRQFGVDAASDTLDGGEGNDQLIGSSGDFLSGGPGDDRYEVVMYDIQPLIEELPDAGIDSVKASGNFTLPANVENLTLNSPDPAHLTRGLGNEAANHLDVWNVWDFLNGGRPAAYALLGLGGDDILDGGEGRDNLVGGLGNDTLSGWEGNDFLRGGPGRDLIIGSDGNDTLIGGLEADLLGGNKGLDTFVYADIRDTGGRLGNCDQIYAFVTGKDKIDLSAIDARPDLPGDQAFLFVNSFSGPGQVRYNKLKGALAFNLDDDLLAEHFIELLPVIPGNVVAIAVGDFIL